MDFHPQLDPILQYGDPYPVSMTCENSGCSGDKADEEEKSLMVRGKRLSRSSYVRAGGNPGYDLDGMRVKWLKKRLEIPECHHQHLRGPEVVLNGIAPHVTYVDYEWGQVWQRKLLRDVTPAKLKGATCQEHSYKMADLVTQHLYKREAKKGGLCPIRYEIYSELFDELIRQLTIDCPERGLLLLKIRAIFENERQIWVTQCASATDGFTSRKLTELNVAVSSETDDASLSTEEKMNLRIKEKFDQKEELKREVNYWKSIYETLSKKYKYQLDELVANLRADKETIEKENAYITILKDTVKRDSTWNPF